MKALYHMLCYDGKHKNNYFSLAINLKCSKRFNIERENKSETSMTEIYESPLF